ncbi:hypothetical protein KVT40_001464 [Elsinoe batatas]|uniref:Rhodopsin domain-containing protein n=1 Tax=Elsinoe batatas TaxID=2601811 RepID=A0A8K0L995_9PEZI|nr:hypothetical protein KVT40_001464 [Elsinoe batatas]
MSLPDGFAHSFTIETYALYGVGIAIIVIRLIERTRRAKGIRNLQIEDWIAFQLIGWFTLLTVAINKVIKGGGSNFMTPEEQAALAPETTRERVIGSKYVLVSEFGMLFTIWSCKLIILLVYRRLTLGLKQERYILAVSIWVGIGFTATLLALFLSCRPFSAYWSVPASNRDSMLVLLPFRLRRSRLQHFRRPCSTSRRATYLNQCQRPWQQKVPLVIVFGMGLFVIAAAITNKMYAYLPWLLSYDYAFWYMREAAVSVYVTNLPALWSILREIFPSLQTWGYTGTANSKGQSNASERKDWQNERHGSDCPAFLAQGAISAQPGSLT